MLDVTAEERDFYGGHLILLEGVILEFLSCVAMIRRYQAGRGRTDPITSSHARIKSADSMRRKLRLRGFPATAENALREMRDAAGVRLICPFIDDIYRTAALIREIPGIQICREKDYIHTPKPNGYRSYHLVLTLPLRFLPSQPATPVWLAGGTDPDHRHGLLGKYRASAEIQAGHPRSEADRQRAEAVRRRDRLHGSLPPDHPGPSGVSRVRRARPGPAPGSGPGIRRPHPAFKGGRQPPPLWERGFSAVCAGPAGFFNLFLG